MNLNNRAATWFRDTFGRDCSWWRLKQCDQLARTYAASGLEDFCIRAPQPLSP